MEADTVMQRLIWIFRQFFTDPETWRHCEKCGCWMIAGDRGYAWCDLCGQSHRYGKIIR